jgi:hypothetical protein
LLAILGVGDAVVAAVAITAAAVAITAAAAIITAKQWRLPSRLPMRFDAEEDAYGGADGNGQETNVDDPPEDHSDEKGERKSWDLAFCSSKTNVSMTKCYGGRRGRQLSDMDEFT